MMSIGDWEPICKVVSGSYGHGSVLGDPHFGSVKQGITILLFPLNPKRYPATKLDERELCNIFPMFRC